MVRLTRLKLLGTLCAAVFLGACAYHSRLPSDIYTLSGSGEKVSARVLVVADDIVQKKFTFKDYHLSSSVQSYTIDLTKGSLIAAADALGTLFETVEVDKAKNAPYYDYTARLNYQVTDPRENSLESVQWLNYAQMPHLQTQLTLTLGNPHTGETVLTAYAVRRNYVELNNFTAVAYHTQNSTTGTLLLPITAPIYAQQMGQRIRYTLSRDLRECLEEVMQTLQAQRPIFVKE